MLRSWRIFRYKKSLSKLEILFLDVDGVLTNGSLHYGSNGEIIKSFNVRDGAGLKMLQAIGVKVIVVSGRTSKPLVKRLRDLRLDDWQLGVSNKGAICQEFMERWNVNPSNSAFIGDDSIDLSAFKVCGLAITVADAPPYIRDHAHIVLRRSGGFCAVREFCDMVIDAKGHSLIMQSSEAFLDRIEKMDQ